ncbi:MAG: ParB/RepB/Spo0J family partition protein [Planctomycetia bacterium]|nr:ParB/RepB/Spo0J family partition protein [Planctomycetia bacterium]
MEDKVVQNMPVDTLASRPQVRDEFSQESLIGLAQTIRETGVLQPLMVRREGAEIIVVEGHRRLRAAKMAGLIQVPVIIDDRELSESEVLYRQLVTNCQRQGLTPLEKARAIDKLILESGWSPSEAAVKLGLSPSTISKLLAILSLPSDIQDRVGSPGLGLSAAYQISLAGNAEAQARMADELASGTLTRDDAAARTRVRKSRRRPLAKRERSRVGRNRVAIALGDKRVVTIAGPGLTLTSIIEWMSGLLDRLRGAADQNVDLSEAVKLASGA